MLRATLVGKSQLRVGSVLLAQSSSKAMVGSLAGAPLKSVLTPNASWFQKRTHVVEPVRATLLAPDVVVRERTARSLPRQLLRGPNSERKESAADVAPPLGSAGLGSPRRRPPSRRRPAPLTPFKSH